MAKGKITTVELPVGVTVRELAERMQVSPIEVIKVLMSNGVMANINQMVDFDTAAIVAAEFDIEAVEEKIEDQTSTLAEGELPHWRELLLEEEEKNLVKRAPVVTILGHVDHGKTSLLDAIRNADVAGEEYGGITQHIGAYQVTHNDQKITFLDTPGHAAFTAMRARGAQGADLVILVVAANDGVMPQTREAIAHAKAAQVPIIVALNKIDRGDANPEYVKQQLADAGLMPDEWDGDTMVVPVSATQRLGIEDLLEAVLLVSGDMEIVANPEGTVFGTIIEARLDKARGVVATLLVQNGTLRSSSAVCAGLSSGRIRAMFDYRGNPIDEAGPSTPVQIMGLDDVPTAGDMFEVYKNEKEARKVVEERKNEVALSAQAKRRVTSLEDLFSKFQAGETQELRLILRADVQGSIDPIISELNKVGETINDIRINVLQTAAGNITESDIMLAVASDAIVIGFNTSIDPATKLLADNEGVSVRLYNIIYRLTEDVEKAMRGMLEPTYEEVELGRANVLAVFKVSKLGFIAGCRVASGVLRRNAKMKVLRGEEEIFNGDVASLKHEKEDVNEVRRGFECGVGLKNFRDYRVGDEIVCYTMEEVAF
ncbi:MAG: translation initiation factor IF-2 [Anaerolineae bacterium]|jgi:translation initiation factor IF-2|nr:translation initiation factor IF-2 [Anaerolineae bacterium]